MSKAFTREDDGPAERPVRVRSRPGLPAGAPNLMTEAGARRLRDELGALPAGAVDRRAKIEAILASVTVVPSPADPVSCVVFGAKVTFRNAGGVSECRRIVGIDEVELEPGGLSWVSPLARALLGAEPGQRLRIETEGKVSTIIVERIER